MKIGFFDSGFGGLSLFADAIRQLKSHELLYYADTDNVPYGIRSEKEIIQLTVNAVSFLVDNGCEIVVIACNTATSASIVTLREKFKIPIIGMEPAIKMAMDNYPKQKTLLIATQATITSSRLKNLISDLNAENLVDTLALGGLVEFAERGEFESDDVMKYLREEFSKFDIPSYSSLILGCTHFHYFKDSIHYFVPPHVHYLDGTKGTINKIKKEIERIADFKSKDQVIRYFKSSKEVTGQKELVKINDYLDRIWLMQEYD